MVRPGRKSCEEIHTCESIPITNRKISTALTREDAHMSSEPGELESLSATMFRK